MARINKIQASMASGEISPRVLGRVDLGKYQTSVSSLRNFIPLPYGCITKRPGFKYINNARSGTDVGRLIPFSYSQSQGYILEFGNGIIRFFTEQARIAQGRLFSNGTFLSGITGWASTSSGTGAISHDNVNKRLTLTGGGVGNEARASAESSSGIARFGVGAHTVTLDVFTATVTYKVGTTQNGTEIATGTLTTGTGKTFSFTPTTNATVWIVFECAATASIDNVVLTTKPYEIDHPYLLAELDDIRVEQSYDVLYLVHPSYAPRQISRYGADSWKLETVPFDEPAYIDINNTTTTLTPSGTSGSITITASSSVFVSTDVGRAIRFKAGEDTANATTYTGTGTQTNFDIPFYPQTSSDIEVYKVASTGVRTLQANPANYTVSSGQVVMGAAPATSDKIIIQPANAGSGEWGYMIITAYTSGTSVDATVISSFDKSVASTFWRLGAFSATTGYPTTVCLHDQRLYFGNTSFQPQTFWGSQIGVYTNFQPDNVLRKGDADDDTSVSFTVASSSSQAIQWMASKGALLLGTDNAVFSARGTNGTIAPTNISLKKEADIPCASSDVAETFNEVLFIERFGRRVHSLAYSFAIDGYAAQEITLLADHIGMNNGIQQIVYQPTQRLLWGRREDGSLVSCTYIKDQEVAGWAQHIIGGTNAVVNSIALVTGATYSEVWSHVTRTINSADAMYIECISDEFNGDAKEDALFMDSAVVYSGGSATTISGLTHLEGESVTVLAQGNAHQNCTVSGGSITLNYAVTKAVIGLGFTASMTTNPIEGGSQLGSSTGALAKISDVTVRLFETLSLKIGFSADATYIDLVEFRKSSTPMDSSPPLYTGLKTIKFPKGYTNEYQCYLLSEQPLPCTVLNLAMKATVADA